jgi:hypothetical protein
VRYVVTQNQAVWERAQWRVEVPDDMPEAERADYVREQAMGGNAELVWNEVRSAVEGMDDDWDTPKPEDGAPSRSHRP